MDVTGLLCSDEFMKDLWRREHESSMAEAELRRLVIMEKMEVKDALLKMLEELT